MEQRIVTTTDQSTHKLLLKDSAIRGYEMKRKEKKGTLAQIWQGGGKNAKERLKRSLQFPHERGENYQKG